MIYIYSLFCPETMMPRYIGISKNPKKRYYSHIYNAQHQGKTYRDKWIAKLLLKGLRPFLYILTSTNSLKSAYEIERKLIETSRKIWPMTNHSDGGPGASGLTEKEKLRRKLVMIGENNPSFGGLSEDHKRKISQTLSISMQDPGLREKRSKRAKRAKRNSLGQFA